MTLIACYKVSISEDCSNKEKKKNSDLEDRLFGKAQLKQKKKYLEECRKLMRTLVRCEKNTYVNNCDLRGIQVCSRNRKYIQMEIRKIAQIRTGTYRNVRS